MEVQSVGVDRGNMLSRLQCPEGKAVAGIYGTPAPDTITIEGGMCRTYFAAGTCPGVCLEFRVRVQGLGGV